MHFLQTVPVLYDMDMVISSFVNVSETFVADTCEHTAAASLRPRFTFFMNIFKCLDLLIKKYIFLYQNIMFGTPVVADTCEHTAVASLRPNRRLRP